MNQVITPADVLLKPDHFIKFLSYQKISAINRTVNKFNNQSKICKTKADEAKKYLKRKTLAIAKLFHYLISLSKLKNFKFMSYLLPRKGPRTH